MKQRNAATEPVNKKYDLLIGIDPGTNCGMAGLVGGKLTFVETISIHRAIMSILKLIEPSYLTGRTMTIKVYIEDSRNVSRGFGGAAKAQGAGSIKRDCNIWEDFLKDLGIDYQFIRPNKKSMLKMNDKAFRALTGWNKRTSNHSRDAAMLVFGRTN